MIIDYFKEAIFKNFKHNPTQQQAEAVDLLARFLMPSEPRNHGSLGEAFVLRGYAGTGKTSLVAALVKTMQELERRCVLMAPTGRAAKVFSAYAGCPAFTIHKRIYRQRSIESDAPFSLGFNSMRHALFIVDEASMISNDDGGNYGTGRLLDDLIQFVYSGEGCRLIFLGDTAQLPPVGSIESPALQPEVLMGYGLDVTDYTLTQVVRQTKESGILDNATRLRQMVQGDDGSEIFGVWPEIHFGKDVCNLPGNELVETLADSYSQYGHDETIVICRSNKRAHIYNMGIRNQILDYDSELTGGDMIMIAKNNYYWLGKNTQGSSLSAASETTTPATETAPPPTDADAESQATNKSADFIANGDIAEVLRVYNFRELYGFRFADCDLRLPDLDDLEITATVLLDTLHTESPALPAADNERLFQSVLEDYADIPYKRDRMKALKQDPYFNALQIKYAYALTCHKAQGGQWSQVFVDQGYITDDMLCPDYYRWLYTALTRAKHRLHLINWPDKREEG